MIDLPFAGRVLLVVLLYIFLFSVMHGFSPRPAQRRSYLIR